MYIIKLISISLLLTYSTISASETLPDQKLQHILTTWEPPTNYRNDQQIIIGTSVDIVNAILQHLNQNIRLEFLPWSRAYRSLLRGPSTMAFTAGKSKQREALGLHFVGPVFTRRHVLFQQRQSRLEIKSLADIREQNLLIGGMRDDWRILYLKEQGLRVEEVTLHSQNVHKLITGRIDLWVTSVVEAQPIIAATKYPGVKFKLAFELFEKPSYLMFSKDTSEQIINDWQHALNTLQETTLFDKLVVKWSRILKKPLRYAKDKGFYISRS